MQSGPGGTGDGIRPDPGLLVVMGVSGPDRAPSPGRRRSVDRSIAEVVAPLVALPDGQ
jgi:hypothetical protein